MHGVASGALTMGGVVNFHNAVPIALSWEQLSRFVVGFMPMRMTGRCRSPHVQPWAERKEGAGQ